MGGRERESERVRASERASKRESERGRERETVRDCMHHAHVIIMLIARNIFEIYYRHTILNRSSYSALPHVYHTAHTVVLLV